MLRLEDDRVRGLTLERRAASIGIPSLRAASTKLDGIVDEILERLKQAVAEGPFQPAPRN
jgi:hypothetical protein